MTELSNRTKRPLLEVDHLHTSFHTFDGVVKAVNDVSFAMNTRETLGIVGESGSGKSVTALSIMRLLKSPPARIEKGRILFDSIDLLEISMSRMRDIRGNRISMIFQEPMTSLNPLFSVGNQMSEMFVRHQGLTRREAWNRSVEMLEKVQIPSPGKRAREFPHHMSGGMRQRVMIAMALACDPEILIADEPTTALDVTIQAQVVDLMMKLRKDYGAAILMITHDLGVIAEIARRVIVMYAGQVVEEADVISIFEEPRHPYTRSLLKSIPKLGDASTHGRKRLQEIKGIVPSLADLPAGCHFYPRCPHADPICRQGEIALEEPAVGHRVRCIRHAGL
ncbi:MAG: ABC transporter ATP-binding protein [Desulfobacteraceae bacterium]|nr:ABC transporter ATP-binding protein [Desulfobacteraceae bacterium]